MDSGHADTGWEPPPVGPFAPHAILAGLADHHAVNLATFECSEADTSDGPNCGGLTDYSGMDYDPVHHRMLVFGGGHATTMFDSPVSLALTETELAWRPLYPHTPCASMAESNLDSELGVWIAGPAGPYPRPLAAHTYDFVAVAPEVDSLVLLGRYYTGGYCSPSNDIGGPIAHFTFETGTWSFSEAETRDFSSGLAGAEYDPISKSFVSMGTGGLAVYDPVSRVATKVSVEITGGTFGELGYANHMTYFPPSDEFYYFMRGGPTYVLVLDRSDYSRSTIRRVTTTGPASPHGEPGYDYDSTNQLIGGGVTGGNFYAFDPRTLRWSAHPIQGGTPGYQAFHALAYDPVNNVFIFVTDYESGRRTWAYRHQGR